MYLFIHLMMRVLYSRVIGEEKDSIVRDCISLLHFGLYGEKNLYVIV